MKIDYINDMNFIIHQLSYSIRSVRDITEDSAQEMISLTIDLLNLLNLYINQFYNDEYDY